MFKTDSIHYLNGTFTPRQLGILKRRISEENIQLSDDIKPSVTTYLVGQSSKNAIEGYSGKINDEAELISHRWVYDSIKEKKELPKDVYAVDWKNIINGSATKRKEAPLSKERQQRPKIRVKSIRLPPYACQRATSDRNNKNSKITEKLEIAEHAYAVTGDSGRSLSYHRAIAAIKACPEALETGKQLSQVRFIGKKMVMKIDDIIQNGKFQEMEIAEQEHVKVLSEFAKVYGVGPKAAQTWYENGCRQLENVKKALEEGKISLTEIQKIALENHEAMKEDITLEDKKALVQIFEECVHHIDPQFQLHVVGGFRREKPSSPELELLVKDPTSRPNTEHYVLEEIIKRLENKTIKHILRSSRTKNESSDKEDDYLDEDVHPRCDLLVQIKNRPLRHVIIALVPGNEWGFGLIEWTGSNHFKRDMKLYAKEKKRCKLSIHNLVNKKGEVVNIDGSMEEPIFEYLGLEYRQPFEREC